MKIELELVQEVMVDLDVNPDTRTEIMRAIQRAAQKLADEKERVEKAKMQFVIVVPLARKEIEVEDVIKGTIETREVAVGPEIGWVVQLPESDSPALAADRIIRAAYAHNATRKGGRNPVKTFGEVCEVVPAKLLKENSVGVRTRLPVSVIVVDNELPRDQGSVSLEDLKRE